MRIARPRTLLSLTLVGLGLVTLPLLIGVGNAVLKLDELMTESADVAAKFASSTRESQRITRALTNMERSGRQYLLLQTDAELAAYLASAESLARSLDALEAIEHPPEIDFDFALLRSRLADVTRIVRESAEDDAAADAQVQAIVGEMTASAGNIAGGMRDFNDDRLAALRENTRDAQTTLGWQAAALVPGTLILVLFFILLVGRPMRQIDRAIRELGKGDFSRAIAVSGPNDIETLGRQLEWLRLRLAESTEEKNKFLRHMSHELKTPLANIREGTELLLDGSVGVLERQQREVTDILRENSLKLQRLIENLLTFSAWQAKTASLEITRFELKPVVFGVLSLHRLVISSRGIKLELDITPIGVRADEGKLRLVLENLLSNAIKFTPEKGTIAISARMEDADLVIEVADSGPGIAAEDRRRVFEAFYQGRRLQGGPVGGTGIGLSVVHECVQAHGGTIELKGESDSLYGGAHFLVRLPLRRAEDRPQLKVAASA